MLSVACDSHCFHLYACLHQPGMTPSRFKQSLWEPSQH
jgi:hypothetical protein